VPYKNADFYPEITTSNEIKDAKREVSGEIVIGCSMLITF